MVRIPHQSVWLLVAGAACQPSEPQAQAPATPLAPSSAAALPSAHPAGSQATDRTPATRATGSWGLATTDAVPLDRWLGRRRSVVEAILAPKASTASDGWIQYGETWALRYEDDCAVELRCELGAGLDCEGAARLTGYGSCPGGSRENRTCVWPDRYLKAEFDPASGVFLVRLLREGRTCAPGRGD